MKEFEQRQKMYKKPPYYWTPQMHTLIFFCNKEDFQWNSIVAHLAIFLPAMIKLKHCCYGVKRQQQKNLSQTRRPLSFLSEDHLLFCSSYSKLSRNEHSQSQFMTPLHRPWPTV